MTNVPRMAHGAVQLSRTEPQTARLVDRFFTRIVDALSAVFAPLGRACRPRFFSDDFIWTEHECLNAV